MKTITKSFAAILLLVASHAKATDFEVSPVLLLDITYGGDTLADIDLDDTSDEEIKAGGLLYLGGGAHFSQPDSPWSYQVNLAYHFDYIEGDIKNSSRDVEMSYDRLVAELISYYQYADDYTVGFGIFKPVDTELEIEIEGSADTNIEFDSELGLLAEWGWNIDDQTLLSFRYAHVKFEANDLAKTKFDGDYLGAFVQWRY